MLTTYNVPTFSYQGVEVLGILAAFWGFIGVVFILGSAILRLGEIGLQTFDSPLFWYHWLALATSILFMGFAEGYRGFQKGFSPRVAARVKYLYDHATPVRVVLAPLFCMGLFDIEKRRRMITIYLIIGIICLVQLVHLLDQPWRGIVDAGVVTGLSWGVISFVVFTLKAFTDQSFNHSPEVPGYEKA